jgi:hypothetical protein
VTAALDEWKPEVEGTMDDIRIEVGKLSKHRERAVRARSPPLLPTAPPPQLCRRQHRDSCCSPRRRKCCLSRQRSQTASLGGSPRVGVRAPACFGPS